MSSSSHGSKSSSTTKLNRLSPKPASSPKFSLATKQSFPNPFIEARPPKRPDFSPLQIQIPTRKRLTSPRPTFFYVQVKTNSSAAFSSKAQRQPIPPPGIVVEVVPEVVTMELRERVLSVEPPLTEVSSEKPCHHVPPLTLTPLLMV